ncbi:ATP-binding protein [Paeniroseomonas aquatica]
MARPRFLRRADAAEAAFMHLFAAAPDGMALLDPAGDIIAANPALGRLAGPTLTMRSGLPAAQLLAPADRPGLALMLATARSGAVPLRAAPADPTAPADAVWSLTAEPLPAGGRLLLRVLDRTADCRAEARQAAGARLETIGRLAGGIAHDFNNLLTAILGGAEAMRSGGLPPAALAELAGIEDAARRGAALVVQLLAFARQQRLQPRILDVNRAIGDLAPLLGRLLGDGVRLELALEEPGRRIRVDPTQFDQVLLNLTVNAREAMPDGGTLTIATGHALVLRPDGEGTTGLPPGRYVVLEVSDTGCGIPPEVLPRLFEPFFTTRPDQGDRPRVGNGAGNHRPVGRPYRGRGQARRRHPLPHPPAAPGRTGRPAARAQGSAAAPGRACRRRQAGAGGGRGSPAPPGRADPRPGGPRGAGGGLRRSALAALEAAPRPAGLISDVAMPGMDGVALARLLRRRWPDLPVVLVSGYAEAALPADLTEEGYHFLAKPYAPTQLLETLGQALGPAAAPV